MSEDSTGLKIRYTEGIVTACLEIRSNCFGEFERKLIENFLKQCEQIFNERNAVLEATQGNCHI